jgi:hypothetical protein
MKKLKRTEGEDMLPEYDFSSGVRGKYTARVGSKPRMVLLDEDVAKAFPDSASVNFALRALKTVLDSRKRKKLKPTRTVKRAG